MVFFLRAVTLHCLISHTNISYKFGCYHHHLSDQTVDIKQNINIFMFDWALCQKKVTFQFSIVIDLQSDCFFISGVHIFLPCMRKFFK